MDTTITNFETMLQKFAKDVTSKFSVPASFSHEAQLKEPVTNLGTSSPP